MSNRVNVLLIDDDEQFLRLMGKFLLRNGFNVRMALDGREGINSLAEAPADIVITDLIMPGQEGIETIMYIKKNYPETPVIAISGGGRIQPTSYLDSAIVLGASSALEKPFTEQDLISEVEKTLQC